MAGRHRDNKAGQLGEDVTSHEIIKFRIDGDVNFIARQTAPAYSYTRGFVERKTDRNRYVPPFQNYKFFVVGVGSQ